MKYLFITFLLFSCIAHAQYKEPVKILQASAMPFRKGTGKAFGFNNKYYQLSTNGSVADSVYFPATDVYKFDLSAWSNYSRKQWSNVQIQIDNAAVANIYVNQKVISFYSVISKTITAGKHKVAIVLTNHTSIVNVILKLGLCYITQTSIAGINTLPPIQRNVYPDSSKFLSVNVWTGGHLRGFNEGTESIWHPIIENNYRDMAALGANLVRHHFTIILDQANDAYRFEDGDLQRFDSMLSWAGKYNFYLNIGFDQDPHSADQLWWGNQKRETSIAQLWKTVAARYANNKFVAAFSPINEPTPAGRIAEYLNWTNQIIDSIRSVDTNHCIVFPWAHDMGILDMMQPLPWNNVIYEYHMYDPFDISTQGINGFTQSNTYPSSSGSIGNYTKADLSAKLDGFRNFSTKYNAPLYIGEFGCVRYAPLNDSQTSSSDEWYTDCASIFEAMGAPWTVQSWRQSEVWDPEISAFYFYGCNYEYAEPTCNYGLFDRYRSDTTGTMIMLQSYFFLNK